MALASRNHAERNGSNGVHLKGHALRNAHLRERSLARARSAPPLAQLLVRIRAGTLQMTRLELARKSGISRGTLRDVELGVHTPTRQTLQQFVTFCKRQRVDVEELEELQRLYTGPGENLEQFIHRLELQAGSPRELARRVGISPTTLWEYRRGNYPLPIDLLRRLCKVVGEDTMPAEELWRRQERQRLLHRGYPAAWAELCVLCFRAGASESVLLERGVSTAAFRRLCYLELPPWSEVAAAAATLIREARELTDLESLWTENHREQTQRHRKDYGVRLKQLRKQRGISRRELADLFGIGGKKPARILKYIEEDGFYSMQAYPAGVVALLTDDDAEQEKLLRIWQDRRRQFHRRRRPEVRADLRLARERYGFELKEAADILGYSSQEYQRIERGVEPLLESACDRILQALHQAGRQRVEDLLRQRSKRDAERLAWKEPPTVSGLVSLLARREGGLVPLGRYLRRAGLRGLSTDKLRKMARGVETPAWCVLERIGRACDVDDLAEVRRDWEIRFRARLQARFPSPLGVELRMLIAETDSSLRHFSPKLGFNYSVLVREFHRIDRDQPLKWFHVERILKAAGVPADSDRWKEMRALWSTAAARKTKPMKTEEHKMKTAE